MTLEVSRGKDTAAAVEKLKGMLDDPRHQCRAAFYLCVLDGTRKEYIEILYSDSCRRQVPAEVKVIKNLVYWEKRARKTGKSLQKYKKNALECRQNNEELLNQLEKVQFELEKMEEIRQEAEKWRMK